MEKSTGEMFTGKDACRLIGGKIRFGSLIWPHCKKALPHCKKALTQSGPKDL